MRALYGIGMGGEWGIGASLAMESVPPRWRGILSGILQSGYSTGYLLAAVVARFVLPTWGWRPMFWLGGIPALLAFYISARVPESEAWKQHRAPSTGAVLRIVATQWKSFLYLVLLMTFMMFLSHGTQDLYPDFLGTVHKVGAAMRSYMAILYNVGAIVGAIIFGQFSDKLGRRFAMIAALGLSLLVIPLWAFGTSLAGAGHRLVPDAGRSARRLGRDSRPPERTFRGRNARPGSRARVPVGNSDRRAHQYG